jgi:hypothetical protein
MHKLGGSIAEGFVHGIALILETVANQGTGQGIYRCDAMAWLRLWMPCRP